MSCYLSKPCPMQTASGNYRTTESHHRIITTIHHHSPPTNGTDIQKLPDTHFSVGSAFAARSDERCWLQEFAPWWLNSRQESWFPVAVFARVTSRPAVAKAEPGSQVWPTYGQLWPLQTINGSGRYNYFLNTLDNSLSNEAALRVAPG